MRRGLRTRMTPQACPSCGGHDVRIVGAIPESTTFAGNVVASMPAELAICRRCRVGFRSPQPSHAQLASLYESGSDRAWSESKVRRDWEHAKRFIAAVGADSVLDVGCFDGGFLAGLPTTIDRAGVEIHRAAAQRARARGVRVVASDLHELTGLDELFDCVVAFDVIEHVRDPRGFLAELAGAVRPGGHLIIATGDIESPTRRLMGSRYLYSWYQEHIAFVSPRWTEDEAPALGLSVVEIKRFSHNRRKLTSFLAGFVTNVAYRIAPGTVRRVRERSLSSGTPVERALAAAPPPWTGARDHFIALLRMKI